jgi:hypothetical protein
MLKWWPTFLFGFAVLFFFANYTPQVQKEYEMLDDGCLIYSLHYRNSVLAKQMHDESNIWSRVLAMHYKGGLGHAVTVFIYKNNTFVYDPNRGSFVIASYPLYDPLMIAEICYPKLVIKRAYFLEPTFLLHYQNNSFKIP